MPKSISEILNSRSREELAQLKSSFFAMVIRDCAENPELYKNTDQIEISLDIMYILEHLPVALEEINSPDEEE